MKSEKVKAILVISDSFPTSERVGKFLFITKSQMLANPLGIRSSEETCGVRRSSIGRGSPTTSPRVLWFPCGGLSVGLANI